MVVGPVSTQSARAWLDRARGIVDDLDATAPDECFTTPEVLAAFDHYLTEWEGVARTAGETFVWEQELSAEQVEYHVHAFQKVAELFAQRQATGAAPPAPKAAAEFRLALLHGVLAALSAEGPASAEFAQHLGQFWPGQDRLPL